MSHGEDASSGDKAEHEAINAETGSAAPGNDAHADTNEYEAHANLPMIESPKLAGGNDADHERPKFEATEAIVIADRPAEGMMSGAPMDDQSSPRSFRFALLAATIALTAGAGALFGSLAASGFSHHATANAALPKTTEARDLARALRVQLSEITALKSSLETSTRNATAQLARISQRLDTLERTSVDPAKIAHITETIDRINRQPAAAPEITGSITPRPVAAAAPPAAPAPSQRIVNGWVVQEVHAGRAMVESRYGGTFLVGPGSMIPGVGRVEAIKRQDGQWVVVTATGIITSTP